MPRVAVIIPTYNRSKQIERAIAKACWCRAVDLEAIVVNDGSEMSRCELPSRVLEKTGVDSPSETNGFKIAR